jgi:hypothetical protein
MTGMMWATWGRVLAQIAEPGQSLSTDLKWLRIPQGTSDTITMFFAVMMGIVITVIATLFLQGWLQKLLNRIRRKPVPYTNPMLQRLETDLREAAERLKPLAGVKNAEDLLHDTKILEPAIARYVAQAPLVEDLSAFSKLRRRLVMTAMNPNMEVVSTRQLLPDLIVRLLATVGQDKLDLYCPILEVSERYLLIDLPYQREIFDLLRGNPDAFLLFWRESDGETAFKVHLMAIQSGHISAFRCEHALRSEEAAARQDFRLTMDLSATFQFVDRQALALHKQTGQDVTAVKGEARMVDLSHGGAALICDRPLEERGFAQLHFMLRDQPIRVMMEVLNQGPAAGGKTLVRGHFRGLTPEASGRLHSFLTQEQFKRIQSREVIRVSQGPPAEPEAPAAAADSDADSAGGETAPAGAAVPAHDAARAGAKRPAGKAPPGQAATGQPRSGPPAAGQLGTSPSTVRSAKPPTGRPPASKPPAGATGN